MSNLNPQEILNAHNSYRKEVGVPPLSWSDTLASHAQEWANNLAKDKSLNHDSPQKKEGENLFTGTSGGYTFTQMVEDWGKEKQNFKTGTFPDVKKDGSSVVGHYTQIVWRNTTQVGCAIAETGGDTILVCRYNPPGNFDGQQPY